MMVWAQEAALSAPVWPCEPAQPRELHREAHRDRAPPLPCARSHGVTASQIQALNSAPGLTWPVSVSSSGTSCLLLCLLPAPRAVACPHLRRPRFLGLGLSAQAGARTCFAPLYFTWTWLRRCAVSRDVDSPRGPWALINQGNPWWLGQQPGGEIQAGTTCDTHQRALPRLQALCNMPG